VGTVHEMSPSLLAPVLRLLDIIRVLQTRLACSVYASTCAALCEAIDDAIVPALLMGWDTLHEDQVQQLLGDIRSLLQLLRKTLGGDTAIHMYVHAAGVIGVMLIRVLSLLRGRLEECVVILALEQSLYAEYDHPYYCILASCVTCRTSMLDDDELVQKTRSFGVQSLADKQIMYVL
jgi:hypothetical protein